MKRNTVLIIIAMLLSASVIYIVLDNLGDRKSEKESKEKAQKKDAQIETLKKETIELKETLKTEREVIEPEPEKLADVFGEVKPAPLASLPVAENETLEEVVNCEVLKKSITNFFAYLDKRDYVKKSHLKNGTYDFFKEIAATLSKEKPVIGEKNSPSDLLKNIYHFYRTINKKNIVLIKNVFEKEKDIIEKTMDYFYVHHMHCADTEKFLPDFNALYEYAHFFLNSMGGKAYLFRLDTGTRILMHYYSTMIIHEANNREINRYGLDLRPQIKRLEEELNNYKKFYYSDKYLDEIEKLKNSYISPSPVSPS